MTFAAIFSETDPDSRPDSMCDLLHARAAGLGEKLLLDFIDDGERLTYRAVADRSAAIARGLLEFGLPVGAKVAFLLGGSATHVLGWFATLQAGMVDVPVNPEFRDEVLDHALRKIEVSALIADAEGLQALSSASAEVQAQLDLVIVPDGLAQAIRAEVAPVRGLARVVSLTEVEVAGRDSGRRLPEVDPRALASIRFSSGTTGMPKGVMMDHGHMLSNARKVGELLQMGAQETMYTCFPFHHVFATVMGVLMTMCAGGTLIIARRFSASRYWNDIREHGVTRAHILDPLVPLLLKQPPSDLDRQHGVTRMYTAAGYYPEFERRFGVAIVPIYDMSELTVVVHYPPGEARRPGSCGKASGLFDIKIADQEGFALPDGRDGDIFVRPRHPNLMFLGYYNDAEQTVAAWRDLWFRTGDRGRWGEDGYFYFLGRSGDRIRRRGVNISAEQVESVALAHPSVLECAAIAVVSPLGEDDIKLCLRLVDGVEMGALALADALTATLPRTLTVRYFEVFAELPKTQTEKVKRAALREMGKGGLTPRTWDHEQGCFWPGTHAAAPAGSLT